MSKTTCPLLLPITGKAVLPFTSLIIYSAVAMTLEVKEVLYPKDISSVWTDHLDKFQTKNKTQPTVTIVHHIPFP